MILYIDEKLERRLLEKRFSKKAAKALAGVKTKKGPSSQKTAGAGKVEEQERNG